MTDGVRFLTRRDPGFLAPGSPEWLQVITPSKVAAILGEPDDPVSRYESPYRLWHRMKGLCPPEPPKDIFDIGHRLEAYAAECYREDHPDWRISPGEVQAHVDSDKFGFRAVATVDRRGVRGRFRRAVEFKSARLFSDLELWGDDLKGECPDDYAAQVMAQMLFTGWTDHPGHLLVVGPYYQHRTYEIGYDKSTAAWMIGKCQQFWDSLQADNPPLLDDTVATYECVRAMHPDIDGSTALVGADLGVAVHDANAEFKAAETRLRGLKTQLLHAMGDARYAEIGSGVRVADRRPHAKGGVALVLSRKHPAAPDAAERKASA